MLVGSVDLSDALPLAQVHDVVEVTYQTNQMSRVYNLTGFTDAQVLPADHAATP